MTSFNKRVFEMLVRVLVFSKTYPQFFAKGSPTGLLIDEIESIMQKWSAHKASQTIGEGDSKISTGDRAAARETLKSQLEAVSRTARGLKLGQFWMSRDRSDRSLVEMGELFASRAEPLKQAFIDSHLPVDFIDQLKAAAQNLGKTISDQVSTQNTRLSATLALDQTRKEAFAALEALDPMMENLLRNDQPTLGIWQKARFVERYSRAKRAEANSTTAGPPISPPDPVEAAPNPA